MSRRQLTDKHVAIFELERKGVEPREIARRLDLDRSFPRKVLRDSELRALWEQRRGTPSASALVPTRPFLPVASGAQSSAAGHGWRLLDGLGRKP